MKCDKDILQNPAGPRKRASSTSEQPSRVAVRSQRSRLVGWLVVDRRDEVVEDMGGSGRGLKKSLFRYIHIDKIFQF